MSIQSDLVQLDYQQPCMWKCLASATFHLSVAILAVLLMSNLAKTNKNNTKGVLIGCLVRLTLWRIIQIHSDILLTASTPCTHNLFLCILFLSYFSNISNFVRYAYQASSNMVFIVLTWNIIFLILIIDFYSVTTLCMASVYSTPVLDSAPIICTFAAVITMVLQSCIYFKQPTNCKEKHSLVISCALFEILLHTLLALAINSSQHMQVDTGRYFHFVTTNILNLVLALIAYYCYWFRKLILNQLPIHSKLYYSEMIILPTFIELNCLKKMFNPFKQNKMYAFVIILLVILYFLKTNYKYIFLTHVFKFCFFE